MDMRVTPQVLISRTIAHTQAEYANLATLQAEATTGNRISNVSDDPVGALQIMAGKAQTTRLDAYNQNITSAQTTLNLSVSTLTQVSQLLTQAQSLAEQGANSANAASTNAALANQVDGLFSQVLALANTQSGNRYLYGGTASASPAFTVNAQTGQVVYRGATQRAAAPVGQTQTVDTLYTGSEVFQSQQRAATVITGSTGATAGSGTDSATGEGALTVAHTSTIYAAGSGIQPGTSSGPGDTIIGPSGANTLTVIDTSGNGTAGTISLNGGPPVAFTNADTDLRVAAADGSAVYVNASAITAGFNGSVAITANGTLSVDGGASTVAINFSGNQVVTNSVTGAVTNINSTSIRHTGTDQVDYTGTADVFQVLQSLSATLRNSQGLSPANQVKAVGALIGDVQRVQNNVLNVVGEQSASLQNLSSLSQHISDVQLTTKTFVGDLQSADVTSVVVNLQAQQNLLQLTLDAASKFLNLSLNNFLQ